MAEERPDVDVAEAASAARLASVIAAAGCGKTEQIANATLFSGGRRLILTHTHAGVDVLRKRLVKLGVPRSKFRLETIAGWCLRYASSFPKRSGLPSFNPRKGGEWNQVYLGAARLINSRAIDKVLAASYCGVFVDEYQDCTLNQHKIVRALSRVLPVCVFGDPLQAIFDFKGQQPVDWQAHVFPAFPKADELKRPWRWQGNAPLATWLQEMRETLERDAEVALDTVPSCVKWEVLPSEPKYRSPKITEVCKRARGAAQDGTLVVIADAANIGARAYIAKQLAKTGFSQIEPVSCATLYEAAKRFEKETSLNQLVAVMDFIADCMSGAGKAPFLEAVQARRRGSTKGTAQFGSLVDLGVGLITDPTPSTRLALLEGFHGRNGAYCFRREMYHAMRAALRTCVSRPSCTLTDAIWETQSKASHAGRIVSKLCIGSTLLVKGLEFEHAVVIYNPKMTRKDWYVAITRATRTLTLLVPAQRFRLMPEPKSPILELAVGHLGGIN
jgi:hypothetical protein